MMDLKQFTQQELLQTYRGYEMLMRTGAVGSEDFDGIFRNLIDERNDLTPGLGVADASLALLQEIAVRWAAVAEQEDAMIRVGTHLWYVNKDTGEIEEAVVETVSYKNGALDSFGAQFANDDFDVFEGSAVDSCFFRSEQRAVQALSSEA